MNFQLIVIQGPNRGDRFPLIEGEPVQIGRSRSTTTRLRDVHCSRLHCTVELRDGHVLLTDTSSRSGTFVNQERVEQGSLKPEDVIQVGETQLQLLEEGASSPVSVEMSTTFFTQQCLDRYRLGDESALEELIRVAWNRLNALARKMFHPDDRLQRWVDLEDVLQTAMVRLWKSLGEVKPTTVRELFALAATQIRRELIDLARHYFGAHGWGAKHESVHRPPSTANSSALNPLEPSDDSDPPSELERWATFHEAVESLPGMDREIVSLVFYHGWSKADVAELLQLNVRTVQKHWQNAVLQLSRSVEESITDQLLSTPEE